VLAAIVLLGGVLLFSESTRTTVADRLGLDGVDIDPQATVTVPPGAADLALGQPIELAGLSDSVSFEPFAPPSLVLGEPDEVYLSTMPVGGQVSYVYLPDDTTPEVANTGVGLLISQFQGDTNESFIQKQLEPETTIELVEVNGATGFWLEGEPHVFFYEDTEGNIQQESIRLAGNVLLWEQDGITLRIESALPKDEALRIAEAMGT
jgi:hypothetical protein